MTVNEVLRLAQLSEQFSKLILMGPYAHAVIMSETQFRR